MNSYQNEIDDQPIKPKIIDYDNVEDTGPPPWKKNPPVKGAVVGKGKVNGTSAVVKPATVTTTKSASVAAIATATIINTLDSSNLH